MPGLATMPLQLAGAGAVLFVRAEKPHTLMKGPGRGKAEVSAVLVSPEEPLAGLKWIFLKSKPKSKCSGDVTVAHTVHPQVSVTFKYPPRARR